MRRLDNIKSLVKTVHSIQNKTNHSPFYFLQELMRQANDPGVGGGPVGPPGLPFPIPPGGLDISTLPDNFMLPPGFDIKSLPPGAIKVPYCNSYDSCFSL